MWKILEGREIILPTKNGEGQGCRGNNYACICICLRGVHPGGTQKRRWSEGKRESLHYQVVYVYCIHTEWMICVCVHLYIFIALGDEMLRFYVVPESQDSCLSSYFQPWPNRSNCNPWVTNIMKKVSWPHRFHFCASFDDFISFIYFLPFFHELVCCFERAIPWVIQSRNSFHLFDILFSLRNGPYKICISFPWVRWYIWYWFVKYQILPTR